MAIHTHLPIYKEAYELLSLTTIFTKNMPKDIRNSIGGEIRHLCLQSVILIARANAAIDKSLHLTSLLEHIHTAEILFRLSKDQRYMSTGQYAKAIAITDSIGKQANGWKKQAAAASAPVTEPSRQLCQSDLF